MDRAGRISTRYDKLHLVPFGEYIPLKKVFPFLQSVAPIGDIERGREYTIFRIPNKFQEQRLFGVLICFEDLFPELSRGFVKRGAQFLVNITNDAWYKKTSAAGQHFQASVFRAVENRLWLARAANTGVSGFVSGEGKIRSLVTGAEKEKIFVEGFRIESIHSGNRLFSFYSRFGDIFIIACFLFVLYAIIRLRKNKP